MTNKLKEAFETASRLPASEQDELAAAILEEIESDARWTKSLAAHTQALEQLADEALAEHRAGRTKPLRLRRRVVPSAHRCKTPPNS